jgi:hypothetical protein
LDPVFEIPPDMMRFPSPRRFTFPFTSKRVAFVAKAPSSLI